MTKSINIFFLLVFLLGTFAMSPGARAFDMDHTAINLAECDALNLDERHVNDDEGSSSSKIDHHDCHHCCHYGHAINLSFKYPIVVDVAQKISDHYSAFVLHIVHTIKRPPRIAA